MAKEGKKIKEKLIAFLEESKVLVDSKAKEILNSNVDARFKDLVDYHIDSGGKRVRASLALLCCLACGGKKEDALYAAAAIEILHNSTLLIDDIIDHSSWRRGEETAWKKFGVSIVECLNFIYSSSVFEASLRSKNPKAVSEKMIEAMKIVIQGEIMDILFEQNGRRKDNYVQENRYSSVSLEDYLEMVTKKTSILIQKSTEIGCICAGASEKDIKLFGGYGYNLGVAFQIVDDILDIYGQKEKFGKAIGQDIREGKLGNILVIYALKDLPKEDRESLLNVLRKEKAYEADVDKVIKIIKNTDAKEKSVDLAKKYAELACSNLEKVSGNQWTKLMEGLVDFVIEREK
mgnify:CR=1 FL=1